METERENTAVIRATSKTASVHNPATVPKSRFAAERNFRICLHIVNVLHARGFITAKDTARMTAFLLKRYRPLIGSLNYPKPGR